MPSIKPKLIALINKSNDEDLLVKLYTLLDSNTHFQDGELFERLSDIDKKDTLDSLKGSENDETLIDHEEAMSQIREKFGWS